MSRFSAAFARLVLAAPLLALGLLLLGPADEASAQRRGDCRMVAFEHINFGGNSVDGRRYTRWVGDYWNDRISSIIINAGVWEFYEHIDFGGRSFRLGPGEHAFVGDRWNDRISSFRCVAGD